MAVRELYVETTKRLSLILHSGKVSYTGRKSIFLGLQLSTTTVTLPVGEDRPLDSIARLEVWLVDFGYNVRDPDLGGSLAELSDFDGYGAVPAGLDS
jgi:hypothetical protein